MPSKRKLEQLKKARAASVQSFKKRKLEASSLPNSAQLLIDDDKPNTSDTIDTEAEFGAPVGNEGVNEGYEASEERGHYHAEELGFEARTEGAAKLESCPKEIKWNREGGTKLRGVYGKGSRSTRKRQKKSARELELGASKTYKLGVLWQAHADQVTIFAPNTSEGLHIPFHLQNDAEQDMNLAMKRTVSKNVPLTKDDPLREARDVGLFSESRTAHQPSIVGTEPGLIPGEGWGTRNHEGNELQRRCDDPATLP